MSRNDHDETRGYPRQIATKMASPRFLAPIWHGSLGLLPCTRPQRSIMKRVYNRKARRARKRAMLFVE